MRKITIAAIAALATVSTAALASVTYDENFIGFVGKGDIQLIYGWNDAKLQSNAAGLVFSSDSSTTYEVTIEFSTGNPDKPKTINVHTITQGKHSNISSSIAYDTRKNNLGKITGFILNGIASQTVTGDPLPQVGDSCPNGDLGDCQVLSVVLVSSTGGGLQVSSPYDGGIPHDLPNTI